MVLDTNLFPRGQAARLDFHAHSLRLLQSGMPGDIAHTVHAAGENRSDKRAPLAKASANISELLPLRGLDETINTFLLIAEYPLNSRFILTRMKAIPKPNFRSRNEFEIYPEGPCTQSDR